MSDDRDEDRHHLKTFKGESNKEYRMFMLRFEAWEDSKEVRLSTSTDRVDELPSMQEYSANQQVEQDGQWQ